MRRFAFFLSSLLFAGQVFGYGVGQSTFPLMLQKRILATEFTGITSRNGGVGLQARLTQKIGPQTTIDGGLGFAGGERSGRIFAGVDYEIFPDYENQPKVTVKAQIENVSEFGERRNILSLAPTFSKGFLFWGEEAYPYIAVPVGVSLQSRDKRYESIVSANLGINGHLPIEGYRHLTGTLEAQINVKDSFSGLFVGLSLPIN